MSVPEKSDKTWNHACGAADAMAITAALGIGYRICAVELQAEAEDHAKFVAGGTASAYLLRA
jgi:hypothetical protein